MGRHGAGRDQPRPLPGAAPGNRRPRIPETKRTEAVRLSNIEAAPNLNLSLSEERSAPTAGGAGRSGTPDNAPTPTRLTAMRDTEAAAKTSSTTLRVGTKENRA